jgi:hypothetical protein
MTQQDQKELGRTLWAIADQLRGAMNADDFRDYMLSFLFLRYLSDNYEAAAKKELGKDYPALSTSDLKKRKANSNLQVMVQRERGGCRGLRAADAQKGALRHRAALPVEQHRGDGAHPAQGAAGDLEAKASSTSKKSFENAFHGLVLRDQL